MQVLIFNRLVNFITYIIINRNNINFIMSFYWLFLLLNLLGAYLDVILFKNAHPTFMA